jgi:predicted RNase H-like HicB family nuclease
MTAFYVALLERRGSKRIFARIPDLPEICAMGASRAAALTELLYLANEHVRLLVEHAEPVPPARDIDDVSVGVREHGRALIPVEIPGKSVKISISIDEALLRRIDRAAADEGTTRSAYFATAAANAVRPKT